MAENGVVEFKQVIDSFGDVLDQLFLKCVAVKNEGKWLSIYTGLILNSSEDSKTSDFRIVVGSELIALSVSYPRTAFEGLVNEILSGKVSVNAGTEIYEIFLTRFAAGLKTQNIGGPQWQSQNIWRPQRQYSPNPATFQPWIVLQTTGDRFYEVLSSDDNARISKALRAHRPAYDGLDGLLKFFECRNRPNGSTEAVIEMKGILPFRTVIQNDQVFVECPSSFAPKVSVLYFFSGHESVMVSYTKHQSAIGRANWVLVPFSVEWPNDVSQAEADVLYGGEELERVTVHHWASGTNWRVLVDGYFDPESKLLQEALKGSSQIAKEEKRSEAFEQAIARLLNLAGIAATWHGALRLSSKPDLAAYCEVPGRRIVLIGECTLEKPSVKLSSLRARLSVLMECIGDSAELLPVVFTACDPVPSDYSDAAQANVTLIGRNEIAWLIDLVERNASVSEIIKQIENTRTIHNLPDVPRWADRF